MLLDPSGVSPDNLVAMEQHAVAASSTTRSVIVALQGPFFLKNLTVTATFTAHPRAGQGILLNQAIVLTRWVDYYPCFYFAAGTASVGQTIYAGIMLADYMTAGQVRLGYQSLGGQYQIDASEIASVLATPEMDPMNTDYSEAFDLEAVVFPAEKSFSVFEKVALSDIQALIGQIASDFSTNSYGLSVFNFRGHIQDTNNPHADTAATYYLDKVPNWPTATPADVTAGTLANMFVTPKAAAAGVGSRAVVPEATNVDAGVFRLNIGSQTSDATDNARAITTAGLLALKRAVVPNAIKLLFDVDRHRVNITPFPIVYPVMCLGRRCENFTDIRQAVFEGTNLAFAQGSAKRGCFWFPNGYTLPNLTVTSTT